MCLSQRKVVYHQCINALWINLRSDGSGKSTVRLRHPSKCKLSRYPQFESRFLEFFGFTRSKKHTIVCMPSIAIPGLYSRHMIKLILSWVLSINALKIHHASRQCNKSKKIVWNWSKQGIIWGPAMMKVAKQFYALYQKIPSVGNESPVLQTKLPNCIREVSVSEWHTWKITLSLITYTFSNFDNSC